MGAEPSPDSFEKSPRANLIRGKPGGSEIARNRLPFVALIYLPAHLLTNELLARIWNEWVALGGRVIWRQESFFTKGRRFAQVAHGIDISLAPCMRFETK